MIATHDLPHHTTLVMNIFVNLPCIMMTSNYVFHNYIEPNREKTTNAGSPVKKNYLSETERSHHIFNTK